MFKTSLTVKEESAAIHRLEDVTARLESAVRQIEGGQPAPKGRDLSIRECWRLCGIESYSAWHDFKLLYGLRPIPGQRWRYLRAAVERALERRASGYLTKEGEQLRERKKLSRCGVRPKAAEKSSTPA